MSIRKYSTPEIKKGRDITSVPKGSTKAIEQAKQIWFVQYMYEGKQIRVKGGLNRIKNPEEKAYEANVLLSSIKDDLKNGFNPLNPEEYIESIRNEYISLNIVKFRQISLSYTKFLEFH